MIKHPFALDEAISNIIEGLKKDKKSICERYYNPDFDPGAAEWPHTIECFREWYHKNAGILHLIKPLKETLNCGDYEVNEIIVSTFSESVERAFDDIHDLLDWAIHAWEYDPLILEIGRGGVEEAGANAKKGQATESGSKASGERESPSNLIPLKPAS